MQKSTNHRNNYPVFLIQEINKIGDELNTILRHYHYSVKIIKEMEEQQTQMDYYIKQISTSTNLENIYMNDVEDLVEKRDSLGFFKKKKKQELDDEIARLEQLIDTEREKSQGYVRSYQNYADGYNLNTQLLREYPIYNNPGELKDEYLKLAKKYNQLVITLNTTFNKHYPIVHLSKFGEQTLEPIEIKENQKPDENEQ